jgi:hypothetical protein
MSAKDKGIAILVERMDARMDRMEQCLQGLFGAKEGFTAKMGREQHEYAPEGRTLVDILIPFTTGEEVWWRGKEYEYIGRTSHGLAILYSRDGGPIAVDPRRLERSGV